ncbi:MAG TPA: hypothetical protein VFN35_05010 [Ktedonobacteraceae bacterium]|nr:hypothetical protein [Ktedonobacteraceae bacterium]
MVSIQVKSTVIYWLEKRVEVTSLSGEKRNLALDKDIQVTMVGHPNREQKSMQAQDLDSYLTRGYIIEQIDFEE